MKNQSCPKNDCMYLHELGDDLASFTKEQMQQVGSEQFCQSFMINQCVVLHEEDSKNRCKRWRDGV